MLSLTFCLELVEAPKSPDIVLLCVPGKAQSGFILIIKDY